MELGLKGKVALVTGSSRGIGRGIALAFAAEGCDLLLTGRDVPALEEVAASIRAKGRKAAVQPLDLREPSAPKALVETAKREFGGIDILINNAALRREKPFADMSYAEWREILDVTLDGAFHCAKECLTALRKSGAGTIVNIGGLSAHTGARDRAHVVTAKAGIIGFTRALAHDLASDGITVNCVVPGLIGTPRPKDKPEPAHHLTHQTISGERGRPEDVAATVRFLCGPGARYINGQAIHANGGAYLGA
jgi:3-oxoacyl-[acyl-carrier protein] reductase